MKISLQWLNQYVDLSEIESKDIAQKLTLHTAEVEGIKPLGSSFENMVVGKILEIKKHPDADKLTVCTITDGQKNYQVVCGASNIYVNMLAPFAKIGAKVRWHGEGEPVTLQAATIRGIQSEGMLCAGEEIGLQESNNGIVDLIEKKVSPGTPLAKIFGQNDVIFEIDNKSLTHRPDLWGHYGIARELAAIYKKRLKSLKIKKSFQKEESLPYEVSIHIASNQCPRYSGRVIKNIKVGPSPSWLKNRIESVGYQSVNNIVDATNYVMAEMGQPLHAFDMEEIALINGKKEVMIRNASDHESFEALDGKTYILSKEMLVIADQKKILALAGVIGGQHSKITDATTTIFLESANFEPYSTRKTGQKLGLRTEAVQRFEKNLDPTLTEIALHRVMNVLQKLCPKAKIATEFMDVNHWTPKTIQIPLNLKRLHSKIGKEIPKKTVTDILKSLEFTIKSQKQTLEVTVPSHRATKDILIEDDLMEEVARMYGYENIEPTLPLLPVKVPRDNPERRFKHKARKILAYGLGFTEVYNYSFYSEKDYKKCLLDEKNHIKIHNFLSEEQTHLRTSLLPNIIKNVKDNLKFRNECKLYEIGRIYRENGAYMPDEKKIIMGCIVGKGEMFYEALGAAEAFLKHFLTYKTHEREAPDYAHPSKYVEIHGGVEKIGAAWSVNPTILKNHDIEKNIGIFEIDLGLLTKLNQSSKIKYQPLPKFPETFFDVSVVVPERTKIQEIKQTIQGSKFITNIELFDIFAGPPIEKGKKALAFKVTLRSNERTLTDEEMAEVQKQIFQKLIEKRGEIRGLKK